MSDMYTDRMPPQNIEAEQAVLGAIFLESEALITSSERLAPEDFYRASHQRIYQVMLELGEKGSPVDLVTVTSSLQNYQWLEEVGGISYLTDLANSVPTAANVDFYSKSVQEKSLMRRLIRTATDIATDGYSSESEVEDILNEAERSILEVANQRSSKAFVSIKDVLIETYDNMKHFRTGKAMLPVFRAALWSSTV